MQSAKWTLVNTKGQGHLLTFVLDASDSVYFNYSLLKLLSWLKPSYIKQSACNIVFEVFKKTTKHDLVKTQMC